MITGAATGIGCATALIFARNGALVVLFGLGDAELDAAAAEAGGEAVPSDVTESADIVRATRLRFYALML
ncbi:NADP-dependent 3-hydroxy acid dehydrogenase YdfG [Bradyrhizobium sp. i1.15.2]|uniref:SDR family oxidoreductase n=1 Tax=Bradyrhizobium sp. i1.15.2 TaxID=3156362 RepID=UPI003399128D